MDNCGDILQLCRLCLVKDNVNTPIFEEQGDIGQIFGKISSCLPVTVAHDDKLPQNICDSCTSKLDIVFEFWNTSTNAEKQLLDWIKQETSNQTIAQEQPSGTIVKEENDESQENQIILHEETWDQASSSAGPSATVTSEGEPPPKRARRAAAMKAALTVMAAESEDEDDLDLEPMTKVEDETDDEDDPAFGDVPSTSPDNQPGPSGVGKDGIEAPWEHAVLTEDSDAKYQCAICGDVFEDKEKFLEHNINLLGLNTCCRCQETFKTCEDLYEHYDTHKEDLDEINPEEEEVEELVLNYNNEEVIVQQTAVADANELLYILDDSQCVNEVVIQEEENVVEKKQATDNVTIVNLEHGYMIPEGLETSVFHQKVIEEDDNINLLVNKRLSLPVKPSTSKKVLTQPKPRTPQPKRRHEVPDFSASNYDYISANEEIDVPHYKCLRCEQIFINKLVFFRHIEKGKCYINNCDVCNDTFSKNSDFYLHYVTEHTDRAICNFCFRTFMYEKNVKEHMLRHLDQFRHRCEECNKGFYTVREYRNHYKNRHMGIRHKCEVCGRSFADEYYFKRHIATHTKGSNITFVQINQ